MKNNNHSQLKENKKEKNFKIPQTTPINLFKKTENILKNKTKLASWLKSKCKINSS